VAQPAPSLALLPELRIDGNAADLVPIQWIAVNGAGTVAVGQPQDHLVKFFNSGGRLLGAVGRSGRGPGEFSFLTRAGWTGDTLWVYDGVQRRFTLIGPDRDVLRVIPQPPAGRPPPGRESDIPVFPFLVPLSRYRDGSMFAQLILAETQDAKDLDTAFDRFAHVDSAGRIQGTMLQVPDRSENWVFVRSNGRSSQATLPFRSGIFVRIAPDGSRIAQIQVSGRGDKANTFRLTMFTPAGDTLFARRYEFEPVPIPRSVGEKAIAERYAELRRRNPPLAAEYRRRATVPAFYPPLRDMVLGSDGSTWILLRPTEEGNMYLVLDPAGSLRGRLLTPANVDIEAADGTHVWASVTDEFGVESVIRYRVVSTERDTPALSGRD
jgi:hypothetical protein